MWYEVCNTRPTQQPTLRYCYQVRLWIIRCNTHPIQPTLRYCIQMGLQIMIRNTHPIQQPTWEKYCELSPIHNQMGLQIILCNHAIHIGCKDFGSSLVALQMVEPRRWQMLNAFGLKSAVKPAGGSLDTVTALRTLYGVGWRWSLADSFRLNGWIVQFSWRRNRKIETITWPISS